MLAMMAAVIVPLVGIGKLMMIPEIEVGQVAELRFSLPVS